MNLDDAPAYTHFGGGGKSSKKGSYWKIDYSNFFVRYRIFSVWLKEKFWVKNNDFAVRTNYFLVKTNYFVVKFSFFFVKTKINFWKRLVVHKKKEK